MKHSEKKNGYGKVTLEDGSVYEGNFENGVFSGFGKMHTDDYDYSGEWKNGERNGHGILTSKYGLTYDGEWRDDEKSGLGTMIIVGYYSYRGMWEYDMPNGYGVYVAKDGLAYEGNFKDGIICDDGKQTFLVPYVITDGDDMKSYVDKDILNI